MTDLSRGVLSLAMALSLLLGSANAQVITVFDGEFAEEDWQVVHLCQFFAGTCEFSIGRVISDGNHGAYREITTVTGSGNSNVLSNLVYSLFTDVTYDPSLEGAIASIDYAEDRLGTVGGGFIIRQSEHFFVASTSELRDGIFPQWQTESVQGLVANNFFNQPMLGAGGDNALKPDFSESGDEITFGFMRSHSKDFDVSTRVSGIDNFTVTIHQVPEPATVASLSAAFLICLAQRRARHG